MALRNTINIVGAMLPADITGAAKTGQWISMKNFTGITVVLIQGAWAGGTPAVTLNQAQNVSGLNAKPLGFTKRYQQGFAAGTGYVESDVTNNTFNLPATANQLHLIELQAANLDVDNAFDCVQLAIGAPGAFADLFAALYLLSGPRYTGQTLPNVMVNIAAVSAEELPPDQAPAASMQATAEPTAPRGRSGPGALVERRE